MRNKGHFSHHSKDKMNMFLTTGSWDPEGKWALHGDS